jgi:HEAT repeat protein
VLRRVVDILLPVRRGERRLTGLLFLHSLFSVGTFIAARTVRDALFLTHRPTSGLALMYLASALAVAVVGLTYSPLAARIRRDRMASGAALLYSGLFVAAWALERTHADWIYPVLYVFVEVVGSLLGMQFWTLANDLFHSRDAKRLYGLIGSGGTIATVVVGWMSGKVAAHFGTAALLLLSAVLVVGCAIAAAAVGHFGRGRLAAERVKKRRSGSPLLREASRPSGRQVLASGHLRGVAVLVLLTFFTTTLVDFEFKVVAARSMPPEALGSYFGYFQATVGLLAVVLQFFGTSNLLARLGVIGSLSVLPLALLGGNLGIWLVGGLFAASATKGADTLFRYSVNDPTTQLLYLPAPPQLRAGAKAFIDGVIKPCGIALAGTGLILAKPYLGQHLGIVTGMALLLCLFWGLAVLRLRSGYVRSLQENLRRRRSARGAAPVRLVSEATRQVLVHALEGEESEIRLALELLPELDDLETDHRVEVLLDHPSAAVRRAALQYYATRGTLRFANSVFRKLDDSDDSVRASAIRAFCTLGRDKSVRSVRAYLASEAAEIRGAAVSGIMRYGGLDGMVSAAETLKTLIRHERADMRAEAARALGDIGVKNFYQPVLELMNDPDADVRRRAFQTAGILKSPELILPLLYKAQLPLTSRDAVQALSAYGVSVLPTLTKVLDNRLEDVQVRRAAIHVTSKLGDERCAPLLARQLADPDEPTRTRAAEGLLRLGSVIVPPEVQEMVRKALASELESGLRMVLALGALGLSATQTSVGNARVPAGFEPVVLPRDEVRELLRGAVADKLRRIERRVFLGLAALFPDADMASVLRGLHDAEGAESSRQRADASELLDNVLDRELQQKVIPFVEDAPPDQRLRRAAHALGVPEWTSDEALQRLCADDDAWVRACAIHHASAVGSARGMQEIMSACADADPVVRETALVACLAISSEDSRRALVEASLKDPSPLVRRHAEGRASA